MTRFIGVLLFALFCSVSSLSGQTPVVMWQKCLGGNNGDYAFSIEPTSDGGNIVAGMTEGQDNGDVMGYHGNLAVGDIWVVKTDNTGNIQWQKCLGGMSFETGAFIHQTSDGGYVLAGTSASVDCNILGNHGGADYWVVKLNFKGDVVWQKMYGGSQNEYAWSLALAPDGGYFVAGETESSDGDVIVNHGIRDFWVIKLDITGNLQWQKSLGGTGDDEAYSVQATNDGGCVVAGFTSSNDGDVSGNHGKNDYWVVKLDNTGNIQWQKALGGSGFDGAWSIQVTTDGGYIVAGYSGSNDGDVTGNHQLFAGSGTDYWVVKLNNTGNIQWEKCYGGNANEIAYFIQPTNDGGYVVAGSAESSDGDLTCNAGITDMWIIKINSQGTLQWQKEIGGNYYDEAHCVKELTDGSFIIAGNTCSRDIAGYHIPTGMGSCGDFWIVKLSAPVSVIPNPVITINSASANICAGVSATLTSSILYSGLNPSFQWTRNGAPVGTNNSSYTASDFANNDQVICTITSGGTSCETTSAQASDAVTIKVNNNMIDPQINITADNTFICTCTTITFKASVSNGGASPVYKWIVNGLNTGSNSNIFITNTLKQGDIISCLYSDNTSCLSNGSVISNSIRINSGISSTPSIIITASSDTICTGSIVTFNANPVNAGANPTYQWKVNRINSGTNSPIYTNNSLVNSDMVTCEITSDPSFTCGTAGTVVSNGIFLNVFNKAAPSVNIIASQDTICNGSSVTFTANPSNAGSNPAYQWKINGVNAGINSRTFTTSSLVNADITSCTITTDPLFTCALGNNATSNNIPITVRTQTAPSATITASANDVCAGEMITFNAAVQNAGASPSYQWILNNKPINDLSQIFSSNTLSNGDSIYCLISPGVIFCSSSPVSSNILIATIENSPKITISPVDTIINIGQQVQLKAVISGNIVSYQWTPSAKLEDPFSLTPTSIHLTDNTTYTLTAKTDKGCEASLNAIVKVERLLLMPNAFSPNGDGLDDIFRIPSGVSLQLQEFSIFDRWGNKMFTTQKISEGWNGTFNGEPVDAGTYVYFLKGSDEKGNVFLKGTVLLIR